MKATSFAIATAVVAISTAWAGQAFAGNSNGCQGNCAGGDTTNNYDQRNYGGNTNNAGGQGGNGYGGSGTGVGVGIAGASADVKNTNTNANISNNDNRNNNSNLNAQGQMQGQGQQQGQGQGQHQSATGGSTNVNFEGSTYKEAAQTAYAPTPSGPRTSCRIFIGFGGSSTSGSLSGGVPLLNDGLCVAGAQVEFMNTVNKIQANTFSVQDYLVAVCAVEGMDKMAACKK